MEIVFATFTEDVLLTHFSHRKTIFISSMNRNEFSESCFSGWKFLKLTLNCSFDNKNSLNITRAASAWLYHNLYIPEQPTKIILSRCLICFDLSDAIFQTIKKTINETIQHKFHIPMNFRTR